MIIALLTCPLLLLIILSDTTTGNVYIYAVGFNARHPWYRVPHIFVNIEEDEASDFNRAHAAFKTSK